MKAKREDDFLVPKLIQISAIDMTIYKFVLPLMDELRERGWDILVASNDTGYSEDIEQNGYRFCKVDFVRNLSILKNLKALRQMIKLLKKEKPDVIHVHTPIAAVLARVAVLLYGRNICVIYTLHGLIKKPVLLQVEWLMCRMATDYIFTVNQEDRLYLLKHKFLAGKGRVINLNSVGINTKKFSKDEVSEIDVLNLHMELGINKPVIGFVGRLVQIKGVQELLEAFYEVRKTFDCQLLLVGPDDLGERSENTIDLERARKHPDIIMTGKRDDIPELLSLMDIFVSPSYFEGMCVSTLEAMAMELPVIATDIRGIREEITPDVGILVPVGEVQPLVDAMFLMLNNPENAKIIGKRGRARVVKYFDEQRVIKKQLKLFQKFEEKTSKR